MVRLTDAVPSDTSYVADTLTLNGLPVGQPDGGVFPLEAGVWISSSDLTPPVPGPGEGMLSSREVATIQFDVRVDDERAPWHLDHESGHGEHRGARRAAHRWRWQSGDGTGTHHRRGW